MYPKVPVSAPGVTEVFETDLLIVVGEGPQRRGSDPLSVLTLVFQTGGEHTDDFF